VTLEIIREYVFVIARIVLVTNSVLTNYIVVGYIRAEITVKSFTVYNSFSRLFYVLNNVLYGISNSKIIIFYFFEIASSKPLVKICVLVRYFAVCDVYCPNRLLLLFHRALFRQE